MTDHRDWDELAAGYALHALSPDEQVAFEAHQAGCERCTANVDEHALTAAALGSLAHPEAAVGPPSWASIRTAVLGSRPAGTPGPAAHPDELAVRRRRREVPRRMLAAAAAVVVLAVGGLVTWRLTGGTTAPAGVSSCRTSSGCHVVALRAQQGGEQVGSVLVDGNRVTMLPSGMSAAAAGRSYVLWQVARDGKPAPVTRFRSVGEHASADGTISVPYSDVALFAVSEEPANLPLSTPSKILAVGSPGTT